MGLLRIAGLFACKALWWLGAQSAGRYLLRSLDAPDENVRTIAGMFLVQAGTRAEPLVKQAIERGEHFPTILTIAADIGAQRLEPEIRRLVEHPDAKVASAARDALETLALQNHAAHGPA
jgi:hypothetical protein